MDKTKISIIIPVYNGAQHLRTCLDSVLAQTHQNIEVILVDDGSQDGSGAICHEYAGKDSRVLALHKENGGVSSARNCGLGLASGAWIGFVDADDWIAPDMLAYMLQLAQRYDADIAQSGVFFQEDGQQTTLFCMEQPRYLPYRPERYTRADWSGFSNPVWNKLYRAALVKGLVSFTDHPIGEDLLFNLQAMLRANAVVYGTAAKYHYVQRQSSACHQAPKEVTLTSHRRVLKEAMSMLGETTAGYDYFRNEQLRNDMDICSKLARFFPFEYTALREEIRSELKADFRWALAYRGLSWGELGKMALIIGSWNAYRRLLVGWKRIGRRTC